MLRRSATNGASRLASTASRKRSRFSGFASELLQIVIDLAHAKGSRSLPYKEHPTTPRRTVRERWPCWSQGFDGLSRHDIAVGGIV